jgi:hypothetical protein
LHGCDLSSYAVGDWVTESLPVPLLAAEPGALAVGATWIGPVRLPVLWSWLVPPAVGVWVTVPLPVFWLAAETGALAARPGSGRSVRPSCCRLRPATPRSPACRLAGWMSSARWWPPSLRCTASTLKAAAAPEPALADAIARRAGILVGQLESLVLAAAAVAAERAAVLHWARTRTPRSSLVDTVCTAVAIAVRCLAGPGFTLD